MADDWEEGENPWRVEHTEPVRQNSFFTVEANHVVAPDGEKRDYDVIRVRRLGVGILPIAADGTLSLIGQWRFPIARYSWELPAGGSEQGEDALTSAKRELKEESGLVAHSWLRAIDLDLSTTLTDERAIGFIAWDIEAHAPHPEDREVLKRRRLHFTEALDGVTTGRIREALSVAILLRAFQLATLGQLPEPLSAAMLRNPTSYR